MGLIRRHRVEKLTWAAIKGNIAKIKKILSKHPDLINDPDRIFKKTALMYASSCGKIEIVSFLLKSSADPNIQDKSHGRTALMYAAETGHEAIVTLLIDNGANIHLKDDAGCKALDLAKQNRYINIEALIEKKDPKLLTMQEKVASIDIWKKINQDNIEHITQSENDYKKLTNLFNFESCLHTLIVENVKTNALATSAPTKFKDLPAAMISKAVDEFTKQGGNVNQDFVIHERKPLEKQRKLSNK